MHSLCLKQTSSYFYNCSHTRIGTWNRITKIWDFIYKIEFKFSILNHTSVQNTQFSTFNINNNNLSCSLGKQSQSHFQALFNDWRHTRLTGVNVCCSVVHSEIRALGLWKSHRWALLQIRVLKIGNDVLHFQFCRLEVSEGFLDRFWLHTSDKIWGENKFRRLSCFVLQNKICQ